ncbi:solute:Na+ symporter, SSS family [Dethiosulfatibacter aminovorans DSM 17477]|uniref:Solute:Na+ symporter, SSS family n=1 Tax=Dethiosulfatibacter aminovorans DSM 17477 TaxID=1121476 RepID=A0A1M6J5G7_9FIRM|nr:sodium:solute symporter family protein [Dethiosulfatibacter aminovorans]SHJ41964.1 solute:Na+ symporter, SSS family [Dethiosulfatibacter aminovorans DSM 17477]
MEITNNPKLLIYLVLYSVVMVAMGIRYSKKITNSEDFILAGKGLGPFILMGTLIATWCGSGTVTGGPNSLSYSYGLIPGLMFAIPSIIGIVIIYKIAPKVRARGKYTVSEILEEKYGPFARGLASIIIILAFIGIVSYQYKGFGFILNVTTGISVELGTIIGAVLIIFLASIGGLMSVAPTDALSSFLMLIGLELVVPAIIAFGGGWEHISASVPAENNTVTGSLSFLQLIGFYLPLLVLLLSDQNMYQRLASSKEDKSAKIGMIGWFIGVLIIMPSVAVIAYVAKSIFPDIAPGMALISTTVVLPNVIGGILLASAFIITTGNSYLLSAATNVTYDVYGKFINPNATDREKLMFIKTFVVLLGVIAFVMIRFFPSILSLQMYAYTVYGASLCPAVLAVFFWENVTKQGGILSMLTGVATTLIWEIPMARPYNLNSVIVSLPLAVIVLIIVSLVTKDSNIIKMKNESACK